MASTIAAAVLPTKLSLTSSTNLRKQSSASPLSCINGTRISCQQEGNRVTCQVGRRDLLAFAAVLPALAASRANALLESDEDLELLSKIKESRKRREASQTANKNNEDESAAVQDAVNRLAKAGQAIDSDDFSTASSVLGSGPGATWVSNVDSALDKLGGKGKEKKAAADFKAALKALQSSVAEKNSDAAKSQFVSAAQALELWSDLTGLAATLQGL